jgi:hypothetical protein
VDRDGVLTVNFRPEVGRKVCAAENYF